MNYAIVTTNTITAHGTAEQLWPDTSFAPSPNASFLLENHAVQIRSDLQFDPATEQLAGVEPYLLDGEVFDRVVEALPEPPPPEPTPEWLAFQAAVNASPAITAMLVQSITTIPQIPLGMGVGLGQASTSGDYRTFLTAWQDGQRVGLITPNLTTAIVALGEQFNLPDEFLAALAAPFCLP